MNWKVEATGPETSLREGYRLKSVSTGTADGDARKGTRRAYVSEATGYVDCPVYDRYALRTGDEIVGPALIEERESTCVIGAGDTATVDDHANMIVELST